MDKPDVYWVQDSGGLNTCHINDGQLNYKQSLIGHIEYRGDAWFAILNDGTDVTPDKDGVSLSRARMTLEAQHRKQEKKSKPLLERVTPRVAQAGKI